MNRFMKSTACLLTAALISTIAPVGQQKVHAEDVECETHTEVVDEAVAATCTKKGLTEGKHCSVCNLVLIAQEEVDALGHDLGKWETIEEPTYTEEGAKRRTCSRCKYKETQTLDVVKLETPKLEFCYSNWNQVALFWEEIPGATKYKVYRANKENGTYKWISTYNGIGVYYSDSKVEVGKTYYYKVCAVGGDKETGEYESEFSNIVKATTVNSGPSINKKLSATKDSVTIKWSSVSNADGYYVYRKNADGSYEKIATIKKRTTVSYVDKSATSVHTYKVTAYKKAPGRISETDSKKEFTSSVLKKPTLTLKETAEALKIKLTWKKIPGATGYRIYRKIGKNGSWKLIASPKASATTYTTKAESGKIYAYKICAVHESGNIVTWSEESDVKDLMYYYYPTYTVSMPSKAVTSTEAVVMQIENLGEKTMRVYQSGAKLIDGANSKYDRNLVMYSYKDYQKGKKKKITYVDIKPGESAYVVYGVKGDATRYRKKTTLQFNFRYDGIKWMNQSSIYYGMEYQFVAVM